MASWVVAAVISTFTGVRLFSTTSSVGTSIGAPPDPSASMKVISQVNGTSGLAAVGRLV